jgi:hypothetical protein
MIMNSMKLLQQRQINGHSENFRNRLIGGTYHKAYALGLCKRISPENMAIYGVAPLMAKNR